MTIVVGDSLIPELKEYGISNNIELCYNCGNCTAVCSLAGEDAMFPRRVIRFIQLGATQKLLENPDPWNCFYCGNCSTTCPRDAEPGEIMMGMRRWLTAKYDSTGQARRMYTSSKAVWLFVAFWFTLPLLMLLGIQTIGKTLWPELNIAIVTDEVALNRFAPVEIIEVVAHIYAFYLVLILAQGWYTMWRKVMGDPAVKGKASITDYIKEAFTQFWSIISIKKWSECETPQTSRKFKHWILFFSYISMFMIVELFLRWFQTDAIYDFWHPQRWIGYLITIGLIYTTVEIIISRLRKKEQMHKFSHRSDWLLPIAILAAALTGISVHTFRYLGYPILTYVMYAIHLGACTILPSTQVGVGKWAHIFYRPLGSYFVGLKARVLEKTNKEILV